MTSLPDRTLAVVGADHPNKRGPGRRFGIALCRPGDPVRLQREVRNKFDENAIAVYGLEDIQLGYVRSEPAAFLAPLMDRGTPMTAIFQEATNFGCAIRVAFGDEPPRLPLKRNLHEDQREWWPDEEWPEDFSS